MADKLRVMQAQIAGARQRIADIELLIPRGQATEHQRNAAQQRLGELETELEKFTASHRDAHLAERPQPSDSRS